MIAFLISLIHMARNTQLKIISCMSVWQKKVIFLIGLPHIWPNVMFFPIGLTHILIAQKSNLFLNGLNAHLAKQRSFAELV